MNNLKIITTFLVIFISSIVLAQDVPQGISYQAIARDSQGEIYSNTDINVTVGILQNNILVWEELHGVTTNQFGLISLIIGEGVSTNGGSLGDFDEILWFDGSYSGQFGIEVNGEDFIDLGTTLFLTVPYAFHAQTVENIDDADADPTNELITETVLENDILIITENGIDHAVDLSDLSQDDDWETNGNIVFNTTDMVGIGTNDPTSNFHADASVSYNVLSIDENNAGLTLNANHHIVLANVTNAAFTINLPDAGSCNGREYTIKSISTGGGNQLTIAAQPGQVIDLFDNTLDLSGNSLDYLTVVSDGVNWWIIGSN